MTMRDDPTTIGSSLKEASIFGLVGVLIGILPGLLVAGAFATWRIGGDLSQIGFETIFAFSPVVTGRWGEPFSTAVLLGLAMIGLAGVGGFALGYRKPMTSHGAARWATPGELRRADMLTRPAKTRGPLVAKLGRARRRAPYLTTGEIPHVLVAAPTGSGKGVGVVVPTLLTYPGSVIVLDLKGENYRLTSRRRRAMGDRVYRFSPYSDDRRTHRYNPLEVLTRTPADRVYTEARRIAAQLIIAPSRGAEGFVQGARDILAAGAVLALERGTVTMAAVYDLLTGSSNARRVFADLAADARSDEARRVFNRMAQTEDRVLSSYLSVLGDGGLGIWGDPAVRDATAASDFGLDDLRRRPAAIYLVVGPNDLAPLAPVLRLLLQQVVAAVQRSEPAKGDDFAVLLMMDEFTALGRMEILAQAMATIRGYGGRMMIVVQSLAALRDVYGADGAGNFLANCRLQVFMAPADQQTPDYITRAIGTRTRRARSVSRTIGRFDRAIQEREEGVPLIRPEEIRGLDDEHLIALIHQKRPVRLHKIRYYDDRELAEIFKGQTGAWPDPPEVERAAASASSPAVKAGDARPPGNSAGPAAPKEAVEAVHAAISALLGAGGKPEPSSMVLPTAPEGPMEPVDDLAITGVSSTAAEPGPSPADQTAPSDNALDALNSLSVIQRGLVQEFDDEGEPPPAAAPYRAD